MVKARAAEKGMPANRRPGGHGVPATVGGATVIAVLCAAAVRRE